MVGFPVLLGVNEPAAINMVIVSGTALKIAVGDLRQALAGHPVAQAILRRYVCDLLYQIMREEACGQVHTAEQRCARWLARTQDGAPQEKLRITHEQMAQLLGVRRATVNPILRDFQNKGFISYVRGKLTIIKPEGLEAEACGCHAVHSNIRSALVNHASDLITTASSREALSSPIGML